MQKDERGWRVPATGTIAHEIYLLCLKEKTAKEIAQLLRLKHNYVSVVVHRFKNPDKTNKWARDRLQTRRDADV